MIVTPSNVIVSEVQDKILLLKPGVKAFPLKVTPVAVYKLNFTSWQVVLPAVLCAVTKDSILPEKVDKSITMFDNWVNCPRSANVPLILDDNVADRDFRL